MAKAARAAKTALQLTTDDITEAVIRGLQEKKAHEIVCLDLRQLKSSVADMFVICHGESNTQVDALTRSVEETVRKETGELPEHIEGIQNAKWVLIDYINVVVHIFQKEQRAYYGIERLWADADIRSIEE